MVEKAVTDVLVLVELNLSYRQQLNSTCFDIFSSAEIGGEKKNKLVSLLHNILLGVKVLLGLPEQIR